MAYGQILGQAQGGDIESIARIINAGWVRIAKWETAGNYTWEAPDLFCGKPYQIGVVAIGGGGSGGLAVGNTNVDVSKGAASGGASGYLNSFVYNVNPNNSCSIVVGRGGVGPIVSVGRSDLTQFRQGTDGTFSSFTLNNTTLRADGGCSGHAYCWNKGISYIYVISGGYGGQPSGYVPWGYTDFDYAFFGRCCGQLVASYSFSDKYTLENYYSWPSDVRFVDTVSYAQYNTESGSNERQMYKAFNPFSNLYMLASGVGGYYTNGEDVIVGEAFGYFSEDGKECKGGLNGTDGIGPGSGGGCYVNIKNFFGETVSAGSGADGAVYIYARGVDPDKYAV